MRDTRQDGLDHHPGGGLSVLARTVVAQLALRDADLSSAGSRKLDDEIVAALARAVVSDDPVAFRAMRADMRRARISESELVDSYFPAVARYLGCAWAEDRAPFTDVSIGVARMQAILRQVGRDWTSNALARADSATVLLVLPEGEQHSFGAITLAGQLRRHGISVRLEIGATPAGLNALVQSNRFDLAMISVGCEEKLAICQKLVAALKDGSRRGRGVGLGVAVGGAVLDRPVDVKGRTGADIVTSDPMVAIAGACMTAVAPSGETV
ncbi:MAG: hypothetical protein NTW20_17035 [Rhodobacterales bacterium]|nr:hypothetical protein [Rhodobacterales bacterium]